MTTDVRSIQLHNLSFLEQDGEVVIGRVDTNSFAIFPPDAAQLVRRLHAGEPVTQAASWYETTHGERPDMDDLIARLGELGFLRESEGTEPVRGEEPPGRRFAQWVFSFPGAVLGAVVVALAFWYMSRIPGLRPGPENLFIGDMITVSLLTVIIGQIPGLLIHEWFHALTGRRLGLPTKMTIGRRMIFLVVETHIFGLAAVPRRRRILPYVAGMIGDVMWFSTLTVVAGVITDLLNRETLVAMALLSLAFTTLIRMTWQLYLVLQTDLYFVLADLLRCDDLHRATKAVVRRWFERLLGIRSRPLTEGLSGFGRRDLRVARWYAVPFLLISTWALATVAVWVIPVLMQFLTRAIGGLVGTGTVGASVLDSGLALLVSLVQFVVVGWLMVSAWRQRRAAQPA